MEINELIGQLKEKRDDYIQKTEKLNACISVLEEMMPAVTKTWVHPDGGKIEVTPFKFKREIKIPAKRGPYKKTKGVIWGKVIMNLFREPGVTMITRYGIKQALSAEYNPSVFNKNKTKIERALTNLVYNKRLKILRNKNNSTQDGYSLK